MPETAHRGRHAGRRVAGAAVDVARLFGCHFRRAAVRSAWRDGRACDCRGVRYDTRAHLLCVACCLPARYCCGLVYIFARRHVSAAAVLLEDRATLHHAVVLVFAYSAAIHFLLCVSFDLFDVCAVLCILFCCRGVCASCVCVHACVRGAPPRSYIGNAASGFAARAWQSAPYVAHCVPAAATVATLWLVGPMRGAMTELCRRSRSHAVGVIPLDVSSMVLNATRDAELLYCKARRAYRAAEFVEKAEAAAEDSVDASSYLASLDLVDDDALRVDNASEVCTAADDDIATTAAAAVSVAPDATANGGSAADAPRQAGRLDATTTTNGAGVDVANPEQRREIPRGPRP